MRKSLLRKLAVFVIFFFLYTCPTFAQVGIGTTTPDPSSILDINDATGTKGLLIPRVVLTNMDSFGPITPAPAPGLLVYNTETAGVGRNAVSPGFYYWSNNHWNGIKGKENWEISGNTGTDEQINFMGTTDDQSLNFRTNNLARFKISNDYQVLAMGNGTAEAPFYSWDTDKTMGFWKSGLHQMDFSIDGETFFNANGDTRENGKLTWTFNPRGADMNFRIKTEENADALFINSNRNNIGLGTNKPNQSSQLDLAATDRGLLVNRVALTSIYLAEPIVEPAIGLLVYNTESSGSGKNMVNPGFYYWAGYRWLALDGTNGNDWSNTGNYGTDPEYHYIGTKDTKDLTIRTNSEERMRISAEGTVAIGSQPYENATLRLNKEESDYGMVSETTSVGGASIYGVERGTGSAIIGENYGSGIGLSGYSENAHGIYGTTSNSGGADLIAGTLGWGSAPNNANGMIAMADKPSSTKSNIGIRVISGSNNSISTSEALNIGVNANATDLALYALTEKSNGVREAARFQTNYSGTALDEDSKDPMALLAGYTDNSEQGTEEMYYGGYFYSGGSTDGSYAYTGARYGETNYKIIGNGVVSTIVNGTSKTDSKKVMFAPEAPEVLLEDYGTAKLMNGIATIQIDPIFTQNITVNKEHPLKVFIQLEGDCNGVYVANKTSTGFIVKELQQGSSSVPFSWHIVANRKDDIGPSQKDNSSYTNLRFPNAPKAIQPKSTLNKQIAIPELPKSTKQNLKNKSL